MARRRLSKSSLYWFINNRSFVYMADVRRRFDLESSDHVCIIKTDAGSVFLGLDSEYAHLFQALYNERRIGFELATDIRAQSVVGIFTKTSQRGKNSKKSEDGNRSANDNLQNGVIDGTRTNSNPDEAVTGSPQVSSSG